MDSTVLTWLYLPTAFILGMAHAIEPGHSKTVVAAYLVSIKGRTTDAVTLGITVTITHTIIIFLLAVSVLILGQAFPLEKVQNWLEITSALLVVGMGLWLIKSRYAEYASAQEHQAAHAHGAHHEHHGHSHNLPLGQRLSFRQLIAFGLSGGLIPCPAALAILILAVGMGKPVLGLCTVIVFSVGLALALIAIGITVSKGTGLVEKRLAGATVIKLLPVLSSIVVTVLGLVMLIKIFFGHT